VSQATHLQQLFPGGDFAWAFRMRKADPAQFFRPQDKTDCLMQQRAGILDQHPERHLCHCHDHQSHLKGLRDALVEWQVDTGDATDLESLARHIETDFVLLDQATQSLKAAAVCFPSSWDPAEWPGAYIQDIHAVVPRLNVSIGAMITKFLTELKPGKAFQRANWSFTRSAKLNYHPALERPILDDSIRLEEIHLRIEHQLFTAIEDTVIMGIRIEPIALLDLAGEQRLWANLIQILDTMPDEVARYKSLHLGKDTLIRLMRAACESE